MRTLLIIAAFILPLTASAQFRIALNGGYGSYAQKDLTRFMIDVRNDLNVNAKITESFPSYYNVSLNAYHIVGQLNWGVSLSTGATGARVSYQDFSGSLTRDMLVTYRSFGIPVGWTFNPDALWKLTIEATPYYTYTDARYSTSTIVGNEKESNEDDMYAINFTLQPALYITREIGRFGFHVKGGYNLTWVTGYIISDVGAQPFTYYNQRVATDWNGYRVEAGVSIFLGKMNRPTSAE